jgi:hypothetical protein
MADGGETVQPSEGGYLTAMETTPFTARPPCLSLGTTKGIF